MSDGIFKFTHHVLINGIVDNNDDAIIVCRIQHT